MHKKLIPVFDSNNNYIKSVYPRYAMQRVLKGRALWIKNNTALKMIPVTPAAVIPTPTHAIAKVFSKIGSSFSIAMAMARLISLFPNDPFARQKAAGALGGASRSGFIVLQPNREWKRVK